VTITRNFKVFGILVLVIIATGTMYLSQLDKAEAQQPKTYDAYTGEYVQSVSYWGYTKLDGFTTLRLQSSSNQAHPLVYVTFKDSELPVTTRLGGRIYEISYYDNEKITVKETLAF
tara:strand:- start:7697 stop:8044 length:348 start_codon:yes stop_codon:yes gene_type:complete